MPRIRKDLLILVDRPSIGENEEIILDGRVYQEVGLSAWTQGGTRAAWVRWIHAPGKDMHGEITWIDAKFKRQGLATWLAGEALEKEPSLHHSQEMTNAGRMWAASLKNTLLGRRLGRYQMVTAL